MITNTKKLIKELSYIENDKDIIMYEVKLFQFSPDKADEFIKLMRDRKREEKKDSERINKYFNFLN